MILLKCDYYTNTLIHTKYTRMILLKCDYLLNKQLNKMRRTSMVSSACTFTSMSNKVFCLRRRWCKGAVGCSYFLRLRWAWACWLVMSSVLAGIWRFVVATASENVTQRTQQNITFWTKTATRKKEKEERKRKEKRKKKISKHNER